MKPSICVTLVVLVTVVSNLMVEGRLFCFRRVKRGNRCGGLMRRSRYTSPQACCAGKGQGFSERKVKLGRNRFRCVPCLGLVGTGSERKSKPDVTPNPRPRTPSSEEAAPTKPVFTQGTTTAFFWPTPAGRELAVGNPYPLPRDEDGKVIVWEEWSPCSVTCGAGWRSRAKVCDNCDRNDYENVQSQPCMDNFYCPVDGNWGAWYPWEACSSSCGRGTRSRRRKCNYPPPAFGGATCAGDALGLKDCFKDDCPVDGSWGEWSEFTSCSQSCGGGTMTRSRNCDSPLPSEDGQPCQGEAIHSKSCDLGPCPVHGAWSMWSKWSPCSASCDSGIMERSRTCDEPEPQNGGQACEGESTQQQFCYTARPCAVDGGWTEWTGYGPCRAPSCGRGFQIMSRTCTNPRPAHGGLSCSGHKYKRVACYNQMSCPRRDGEFCEWSAWNSCSASCKEDTPLQGRQRVCACPTPRHGGNGCQGEMFQVKECDDITYCFPPLEADVPLVIEAEAATEVELPEEEPQSWDSANGTVAHVTATGTDSEVQPDQDDEILDLPTQDKAVTTGQTVSLDQLEKETDKPISSEEKGMKRGEGGQKSDDVQNGSSASSEEKESSEEGQQKTDQFENRNDRKGADLTTTPKQPQKKDSPSSQSSSNEPQNLISRFTFPHSRGAVKNTTATSGPVQNSTQTITELSGTPKVITKQSPFFNSRRQTPASKPQRIRIVLNASKSKPKSDSAKTKQKREDSMAGMA